MATWPNLFLIGAARAGTTSLYHCLRQHPDIYMCPVKEPQYFSPTPFGPQPRTVYLSSDEAYLRLFLGARSERLVGEASTSYLADPESPRLIHSVSPRAKILVILREPVDRAYSHFLLAVGEGNEQRPFGRAVREAIGGRMPGYAHHGLYCEQLQRYLELFGEQVHVLIYEEVFRDLPATLRETFAFLEVDPAEADRMPLMKHNVYPRPRNRLTRTLVRVGASLRRRSDRSLLPMSIRPYVRHLVLTTGEKPPMDPEARRYLVELYASQQACIEALLGRKLPWADVDEQ